MTTEGLFKGRITEEALATIRSRIGLIRYPFRYNESASKDTIRHFCAGIGDENPLFIDESYAAKTRYGGIVAPPLFLYSICWPAGGGQGLPGVHGFHGGNDWEFFRTVRTGDTITAEEKLVDIVEKEGRFAGRLILMYDEVIFRNQRDEIVAKALGWTNRVERQAAREKKAYAGVTKATYTPEELKTIDAGYDTEVVRGVAPRYWEDTKENEDMGHVVKGPLNLTDMMCFVSGTLGGAALGRGGAHGIGYRYRKRHPTWSFIDPSTGAADAPEMVHADSSMSKDTGVPEAYDYGCQRVCWLGHLITNWMGDDAFLKRLYVELRRFNMLGDTTWCKGKVNRKYEKDGQHLVDCDIWGENQRKEVTIKGSATITLPSRNVPPVSLRQSNKG